MLDICKLFFEHLNSEKIRYCHWKSNEHLDEALAGKTDLDVLVHIDDKAGLEEALAAFPFKKILSPPEKQFPGMSDYLGFDDASGEFIHLHVHHFLVLGQKYIKNHHLPLEDLIFDNLIMRNNVAIPCPEIELILLIIRAHMKADVISLAKHAIKSTTDAHYTAFPADIENEFTELIAKSDLTKLKALLSKSQLPLDEKLFTDFIAIYSAHQLKFYHIVKTQLAILKGLKHYRRNKSLAVYWQYFCFFVAELPIIRNLRVYKRKTLDGPGKIIAIVGADGSGKSTLIKDLHKWLSWKLTVKQYYYGIPKNTVSKLSYYLQRLCEKCGLAALNSYINALFWLYVARTRRSISRVSRQDIQKGVVVITDRFPLKEFASMDEPMDGPRLGKNSPFAGGSLARREARLYSDIQYPDRVFVLQVGIEELRKRKTDLSLDVHKLKAQAVNSLEAKEPFVLIDASKPYKEVSLEIKRLIWAAL